MGNETPLALAIETELGFAGTWPLLYRPAEIHSSPLAYNPLLAEQVNARLEPPMRSPAHRKKKTMRRGGAFLLSTD